MRIEPGLTTLRQKWTQGGSFDLRNRSLWTATPCPPLPCKKGRQVEIPLLSPTPFLLHSPTMVSNAVAAPASEVKLKRLEEWIAAALPLERALKFPLHIGSLLPYISMW